MFEGPNKTPVPVLLKGLDQKQSKQVAVTGNLDVLTNMIVQKVTDGGYEFVPRPGSTNLGKTADSGSITAGYRLATLGNALALFTGGALYRLATDKWHLVDSTAPMIGVQTDNIVANSLSASSTDDGYTNGYRISATAVVGAGFTTSLVVTVQDVNGSVVTSQTVATATALYAVRVVISGNSAIILWQAPTLSLYACKVDTASPSVITAPVVVSSSAAQNISAHDAQAVGASGTVVVAYLSTATSTWHLVLITTSTMAVSGDTNTTIAGVPAFGLLANDWSTNVIYAAWGGSGAGVTVTTFNGSTLATTSTTVYDAATTWAFSITGSRTGSAVTVVVTTNPTGTNAAGAPAQNYDYRIGVSTGGGVSTVKRGLLLASKAMAANGTVYVLAIYPGAGQGTVFLIDVGAKKVVGRALQDVAAFPLSTSGTPAELPSQLVSLGLGPTANTWLTAGLKNIAVESNLGVLTYYVGSVAITFTYLDPTIGRPVELNGVHIPGSNPYFYDGSSLVEDGFPIAPEQSDAIVQGVFGGTALTLLATYTYRFCYAWPDALGNIHRSAPTIVAQSVTMTGANNQNTLSIPTLRTTRKVNVTIEVYRDQGNGDGATYNMISNPANPLVNDPTVDRVTFVDTVPDSQQAGGLPLYTDGFILDNIAPAPCKSYAIHRGRILAGGIDGDPQAVWFSKDVSPGFGVAFSDGLVSRLNSTSQPVTGVASMDTYAVAMTTTTTWASGNEYPDDTGNPGVLQFQQYSSQTGSASPTLLGRTDQGLMVFAGTKGAWRLSRGVSYDYVGSPVEVDAQAIGVSCMLAVPSQNQARVIGGNTVLVYETIYGTWAKWTYGQMPGTIVDATIWNGNAVYLCSDGTVVQENTAVIDDNTVAASVPHVMTLSSLNLAGVAAFMRTYGTQFQGRTIGGTFTLNIAQAFDGVSIASKSMAYTGAEGILNLEVDPGTAGKCSDYLVTLSDSGNAANSAFTYSAATVLLGLKEGMEKLPPSRRAS